MEAIGGHGTIIHEPHFPGCSPIEAYGNGGFRFAGMSHRGGLLVLPSGIYAWNAKTSDEVIAERLTRVLAEKEDFELLFFGLGLASQALNKDTLHSLRTMGIRFEIMSTGAAIRTFNVLIAEGRSVAAALLPVDKVRTDEVLSDKG